MKLRPRQKGISRVLSLDLWGRGTASFLFILAALFLFLFSALSPQMLSNVRTGTTDIAAPFLAALNRPVLATSDYIRGISGLAALQAENADLKAENARLREWYQTAQALQAENQSLHNLLHIDLAPGQTYVTARVIADSGNAYVKSLLVMAGQSDGVAEGQAVLADDGVIGRVVETGGHASRVLLLNDLNSRIPVTIEGTQERAILAGNNDDAPQLLYLPHGAAVQAGARVITSGQGGLFPYGLPVGQVEAAGDGWTVRPFADTGRIGFVRVVNSGQDPRLHQVDLTPAP